MSLQADVEIGLGTFPIQKKRKKRKKKEQSWMPAFWKKKKKKIQNTQEIKENSLIDKTWQKC